VQNTTGSRKINSIVHEKQNNQRSHTGKSIIHGYFLMEFIGSECGSNLNILSLDLIIMLIDV